MSELRSFQEKKDALDAIAAEIAACTNCPLHRVRKTAIAGEGGLNASVFFICDAPDIQEDQKGLPLVGSAERYFSQLLQSVGLTSQEVFVVNLVRCRPPARNPQADEIAACVTYIDRQIEIIQPRLIATMGKLSTAQYIPDSNVFLIHGQEHRVEERVYYPLLHPALVMRNPKMRPIMEADFQRLKQLLDELIAEEPPQPPQQLALF
jgi:DNA polymerase